MGWGRRARSLPGRVRRASHLGLEGAAMTDEELAHVYACRCWRCTDTRYKLNQVWHLWFHGTGGGDGKLDRDSDRSGHGITLTVLHALECTQPRTEAARGRARGSLRLSQHEGEHLGRPEPRRGRAPTSMRPTRRRVLVPV